MVMKALFGSKKNDPPPVQAPKPPTKEQMKAKKKEMDRTLKKQMREIDRAIRKLESQRKKAEKTLKKKIKDAGGRDHADKVVLNIYAKQIVQCHAMKGRNLKQKAQIMACKNALDTQFATMNMAKAMALTSQTVQQINQMMGVKTLQKTAMELQKNMMQMGMITELMEETMEVDSDEDVEADDIIDNIVNQIDQGTYDPNKNPLAQDVVQPQQQQVQQEEDFDAELQQLMM